jgi:flagellar capping protein FliD
MVKNDGNNRPWCLKDWLSHGSLFLGVSALIFSTYKTWVINDYKLNGVNSAYADDLKSVEKRVSANNDRLTVLESAMRDLNTQLDSLEKKADTLSTKVDTKFEKMDDRFDELKSTVWRAFSGNRGNLTQ